MNTPQSPSTQCCPPFDPAPWDEKTLEWKNKKFIKSSVFTFFYMPIGFGALMKKLMKKVEKADAKMADQVCLSDCTSKWNMDIYLAVDKEIPETENVTLSGKFFCKVYEGPFKDTGKWCNDFELLAKNKGLNLKKLYLWYTTCPKCAKVYGKNYTVLFGQVN